MRISDWSSDVCSSDLKQALRRLQEATSMRSAELGLPDGVLAFRRWLEQLLGAARGPGEEWPGPLSGWRRAELEPVLAPLLSPETEGSGLATGGDRKSTRLNSSH